VIEQYVGDDSTNRLLVLNNEDKPAVLCHNKES
jgi:hypothetical protein